VVGQSLARQLQHLELTGDNGRGGAPSRIDPHGIAASSTVCLAATCRTAWTRCAPGEPFSR
jgi:hypothetical protein